MKLEKSCVLDDVLEEDYLELSSGAVVRNLRELVLALGAMSEEDFALHVYGEQNDFAEWILEGYWDEGLAGKILKIKKRGVLIRILEKILREAEKKRFESGDRNAVLKKIGKMG